MLAQGATPWNPRMRVREATPADAMVTAGAGGRQPQHAVPASLL